MKYSTILIDPPWPQKMVGKWNERNHRPKKLTYGTMTINEIKEIPIQSVATNNCHLWIWTTNAFLKHGFDLIDYWGFKYLAPIHWIKPSGFGAWFINRTQTILFAYNKKCVFGSGRFSPNVIFANPGKHSEKPEESYKLIESVGFGPRLELFARKDRKGWVCIGDEI